MSAGLRNPDAGGMRPEQPLHDYVLRRLRGLMVLARRHAERRWPALDEIDALYQNYADPAQTDEEGRPSSPFPESVIVPFSYAACQTLLTAWWGSWTSQPAVIRIESANPRYDQAAEAAESVLQAKLSLDLFELKLYQWLLDALKYGQGRVHTVWQTEYDQGPLSGSPRAAAGTMLGIGAGGNLRETSAWRVAKEGPVSIVIPPRSYFPDPRVPGWDPQQGEFVAFETWTAYNLLRLRADEGTLFNLSHIERRGAEGADPGGSRGARTTAPTDYDIPIEYADADDRGYVKREVMYVRLVPSEWKSEGYSLGDSKRPEIWLFVVANEKVIIEARPVQSAGKFPVGVMDVNLDMHALYNPGDPEVVQGLQRHADWLFNARITSLRAGMFNGIIYNPDELHNEGDIFRVEPALRIAVRGGKPLSQVVQALPWTDITRGLHSDMIGTGELLKSALGATDALAGAPIDRSTSPTEVSILLRQGQSRSGARGRVAWIQGVRSWGGLVLSLLQQQMTEREFFRIIGQQAQGWGALQEGRAEIGPEMVQGDLTISVADVLAPVDREALGGKLLMFGKEVAQSEALGAEFDAIELFKEGARLSGIRDVERFARRGPVPGPRVEVRPDEQVLQDVMRGDLAPLGAGAGGSLPGGIV